MRTTCVIDSHLKLLEIMVFLFGLGAETVPMQTLGKGLLHCFYTFKAYLTNVNYLFAS